MMDRLVEQAAAQALLDRGAAFHIQAPFLFRIVGKKKIRLVVRRLRLGSLLHLMELPGIKDLVPLNVGDDARVVIDEMGAKAESIDLKIISENIIPVTRAVAACLLNQNWKIVLFKKVVGRYLRNTLTSDQIQELVMWLLIYARGESFMNTIRLAAMMKMTSPMNLSPQEKGS
jgi:hypothetical protein